MAGSERGVLYTLAHGDPGEARVTGASQFFSARAAARPVGAHGFAPPGHPWVRLVHCAHGPSDVPVIETLGPSTAYHKAPVPEVCDPGDEGVGPSFLLSLQGEEGQQHLTSRTPLLLPVWAGSPG